MELTGRLKDIAIGLREGKRTLDITFSFPFRLEDAEHTEKYIGKTLSVIWKQYRNRRSKDANNYLWKLLQKMADVLSTPGNRIDKWDIYLQELEKYGVFTHIVVKPEAVPRIKQEWRAVRELGQITVGNMTGIQLQCYYGSHTYDTKEMARLIDGVVTDCKELGIETLPPEEIQRIKEQWGVEIG